MARKKTVLLVFNGVLIPKSGRSYARRYVKAADLFKASTVRIEVKVKFRKTRVFELPARLLSQALFGAAPSEGARKLLYIPFGSRRSTRGPSSRVDFSAFEKPAAQ